MGENSNQEKKKLHILMYPWLAFGHMTPFLHLANELAQKGHKISFFLPPKARPKLAHLNLHPDLISFVAVSVPAVDGLPDGVETTSETPMRAGPYLFDAYELTRPDIESSLSRLRPDVVFYDFAAHWLPGLARKYGARPVYYSMFCTAFFAYLSPQARGLGSKGLLSEAEFMRAPPGFPSPRMSLRAHEARHHAWLNGFRVGLEKVPFWELFYRAIEESDAVCCRSCREMEGHFGDYLVKHFDKPLLWAGPLLPSSPGPAGLDEKLDGWLKGFQAKSVVYCAFGSEVIIFHKEQFQQLLFGLELTGLPFLAVLKPPFDYETIESALPEGFLERVKGRGIVQDGWVQQQLILKHSSIGCFVNHCGAGTLLEALTSECPLVLFPQKCDNFINARLMSEVLRVGVEVERGEDDGFITREGVCNAIMTVIEEENEVGREIRANHAKWREFLLKDGLQEAYTNELNDKLLGLVGWGC